MDCLPMKSQVSSEQELFGKIKGNTHYFDVRIYYEDTDFTGVVYHANYLKFLERARSNFLHLLGIRHHESLQGKFGQPLAFTIRDLKIEFFRPAKIDDQVQVRTKCFEIKGAGFKLLQEVWRGKVQLTSATVSVIVIDARGRPFRVPKEMSACFEKLPK